MTYLMQVQHFIERRNQLAEEHESPLQQRHKLIVYAEVSVQSRNYVKRHLHKVPPVLMGLRVCTFNNAELIWL